MSHVRNSISFSSFRGELADVGFGFRPVQVGARIQPSNPLADSTKQSAGECEDHECDDVWQGMSSCVEVPSQNCV